MAKEGTKKQKLYDLYAQGYDWRDEEAKKIAKKSGTRETYWHEWNKAGRPGYIGQQFETKTTPALTPVEEPSKEDAKHVVTLEAPLEVLTPKKPPIVIGQISIPYEDWGYSSIAHMLVVASTYQEVTKPKSQGGYGYTGPVGDFLADCVKLFRRIFDFDPIREEEIMDKEVEHEGGRVLSGHSEGEAVGQESD